MRYKMVLLLLITIGTTSAMHAQKPQEAIDLSAYRSIDVTFENKIDKISLAGTLTLPLHGKNFPVAILISGSGAQNRDSELLGHKPFLVISDYLTRNGIAVLRVDDRGTGLSEGNYNDSALSGFVNDTKAAIDFLTSRNDIDSRKIGLIGHSLGGLIAPEIASQNSEIAFVIMLAGSGLRGDKLMLLQKAAVERKMGVGETQIEMGAKNIAGAYDIIIASSANRAQLKAEISDYFTKTFGAALPASQITTLSEQLTIPWLADFIRYDPANALSHVTCPILALIGSNDLQVPAKENLEAIKRHTEKSGNKDVTILELPKLNHLFQESESGLPQEYAKIEQTFSPDVLQLMTKWITARVK